MKRQRIHLLNHAELQLLRRPFQQMAASDRANQLGVLALDPSARAKRAHHAQQSSHHRLICVNEKKEEEGGESIIDLYPLQRGRWWWAARRWTARAERADLTCQLQNLLYFFTSEKMKEKKKKKIKQNKKNYNLLQAPQHQHRVRQHYCQSHWCIVHLARFCRLL